MFLFLLVNLRRAIKNIRCVWYQNVVCTYKQLLPTSWYVLAMITVVLEIKYIPVIIYHKNRLIISPFFPKFSSVAVFHQDQELYQSTLRFLKLQAVILFVVRELRACPDPGPSPGPKIFLSDPVPSLVLTRSTLILA